MRAGFEARDVLYWLLPDWDCHPNDPCAITAFLKQRKIDDYCTDQEAQHRAKAGCAPRSARSTRLLKNQRSASVK